MKGLARVLNVVDGNLFLAGKDWSGFIKGDPSPEQSHPREQEGGASLFAGLRRSAMVWPNSQGLGADPMRQCRQPDSHPRSAQYHRGRKPNANQFSDRAGSRRTHDIETLLTFRGGVRELVVAGRDLRRARETSPVTQLHGSVRGTQSGEVEAGCVSKGELGCPRRRPGRLQQQKHLSIGERNSQVAGAGG